MSSKTVIGLIEKIITSTPNTVRAVLAILLMIAAVVSGLWLLKANLTAGPISVTGRETPAISQDCRPASQTTSGVSCAG
ncbi:hypothetical protein ACFQ68_13205 [Amycolatopsis japonica]|uniref:hypothetical protein n=1 Tax=Amycolatopsis japonica TaxID=208439 RepID=UPI00366C0031